MKWDKNPSILFSLYFIGSGVCPVSACRFLSVDTLKVHFSEPDAQPLVTGRHFYAAGNNQQLFRLLSLTIFQIPIQSGNNQNNENPVVKQDIKKIHKHKPSANK